MLYKLLLFTAMSCIFSGTAFASRGVVVARKSHCDYFVVETIQGFAVLEWFGGHDPDRGDVLVGAFEEYGIKDIYDETADTEVTVWVEDYWVSKSKAMSKMYSKCS